MRHHPFERIDRSRADADICVKDAIHEKAAQLRECERRHGGEEHQDEDDIREENENPREDAPVQLHVRLALRKRLKREERVERPCEADGEHP